MELLIMQFSQACCHFIQIRIHHTVVIILMYYS
jgi:hypothetical protein